MLLPDDLKNYEADGFQLISPELAGYLILAFLVVAIVLERMGVL